MKIARRIQRKIDEGMTTPDISSDDIASLDSEISEILDKVMDRPSFDEAKPDLDELVPIQGLLAILAFKYRINISDRQRQIVRLYDRWDDEDVRRHFYNEIVSGRV